MDIQSHRICLHCQIADCSTNIVPVDAIGAYLGRVDEARTHLHLVREQKPDFAPRARELLCRSLKIDAVVDDLIDGLRTAGLET